MVVLYCTADEYRRLCRSQACSFFCAKGQSRQRQDAWKKEYFEGQLIPSICVVVPQMAHQVIKLVLSTNGISRRTGPRWALCQLHLFTKYSAVITSTSPQATRCNTGIHGSSCYYCCTTYDPRLQGTDTNVDVDTRAPFQHTITTEDCFK